MNGTSKTAVPAGDKSAPQLFGSHTPRRFLGFELTLDWIMRPLFGIGLGAIAIAATYLGGFYFASFIAVGAVFAAREWHRMIAGTSYGPLAVVSATAIVLALITEVMLANLQIAHGEGFPWLILAAGALVNSALASTRRSVALWHASALLYIGVPALLLVMIRIVPDVGLWLIVALFIAVWSADTGALIIGNLLKGPKLWPALSPNKTWAGFLGGIAAAALASAIFFDVIHASAQMGVMFGSVAALVGHGGDLFESWMKRKVGRKNSGSLIPGHGGVLDRIDSMLFVAPVAALAFFIIHIDPLAGALL